MPAKLHIHDDQKKNEHPAWDYLFFRCPGCGNAHQIRGGQQQSPGVWYWDLSLERPTIAPSILCTRGTSDPTYRCHSFIRAGRIEFLADCSHHLAGRTVDMLDWDYPPGDAGGRGWGPPAPGQPPEWDAAGHLIPPPVNPSAV